ncbi:MAG: hypothetical protein EA376_06585 [Phycisphaeraceae bacterium]|nr:MAG: hypothetical protein EA376_06585 [Phycisphaeraceae bacterium]
MTWMAAIPDADRTSWRLTTRPALAVRLCLPGLVLLLLTLWASPSSTAQVLNPVYLDDSPRAAESLVRVQDFISSGNLTEAARILQQTIDEDGDRVVPTDTDDDLYVSVRRKAHELLLAEPKLMAELRESQGRLAKRLLDEGRDEEVERRFLYTKAGFEAALRQAQRHLERGAFDGAFHALEQLERHPDRIGTGDAEAAELLTLIARYLDRDDVWILADRWRREAGKETTAQESPVIMPPPGSEIIHPLSAGPGIDLDDMVTKPLWTRELPLAPIRMASPNQQQRRAQRNDTETDPAPNARLLHIIPVATGDMLIINDSESVTAWDRFTMELRWHTDLGPIPTNRRQQALSASQRMLEDLNTVTVYGPWVIAPAGLAANGNREGDQRVHALDSYTGERRWAVDLRQLDPAFEESSVRGPAVIDQGVVILTAVKRHRQRRVDSVHLAGLDLATGDLLWRRVIGSTGSLAFAAGARVAEPAVADRGLVYIASRLGFAGAVESATGRIRWVRKIAEETMRTSPTTTWQLESPQVIDGVMYTISPNRSRILALDAHTGRKISERPSTDFNRPAYLLQTEGMLIAVGDRSIMALAGSDFEKSDAAARTIATTGEDLRGRVAIAGETALAPVVNGILAASSRATDPRSAELVRLDYTGNPLAIESQLIVVDDAEVHTYLLWSVAERMLTERMELEPKNASHAATFAELAHRAGKTDRIIPAVDAALTAIENAPLDDVNQSARSRLFAAVLDMVDPHPDDAADAPRYERSARGELVHRLGRLAGAPEERVRHLLASGAHAGAIGRIGEAVDSYQRILSEESLASARFDRHGSSLDATDEATRRLRELLREYGRGHYAAYEAEAERALAEVSGSRDPDRYIEVARRYPVSSAAAMAWSEAAGAHASRGRPHGAIYALERGLQAAEDALDPSDPLLGELAGRLVQSLARADRIAAASTTLKRIQDRHPALVLTDSDRTIDVPALTQSLATRLGSLERRPAISLLPATPNMSLLEGWVLVTPLIGGQGASSASSEFVVLANRSQDLFGLWGVDAGGGLKLHWSVEVDEQTLLLQLGDEAVHFATPDENGVIISRYDLASGARQWKTPPFRDIFPENETITRRLARGTTGRMPTVDTPVHQDRLLAETLAVLEGDTLVLIERTGRCVAFNLRSGRPKWVRTDSVHVVHDAAAAAGMLVMGGAAQAARADRVARGAEPEAPPALLAIDIETGRTLHKLETVGGPIRWVRLASDGELYVGSNEALSSYDLFQGRLRWTATGEQARETSEAWIFPGRLITLVEPETLWQIESEDGSVRRRPLDARGRLPATQSGLLIRQVGDLVSLSTSKGLALFDRSGELVGMDHRIAERFNIPARLSRDDSITIDVTAHAERRDAGLYTLSYYENTTGRLRQQADVPLGDNPTGLVLIEGRILITAGDATVVLDADGR